MKTKEKISVSFINEPASQDVTGSMVLVKTPNYQILLDCGMFQNNNRKESYLKNTRSFKSLKAKDIDYIIFSHTHIDHIGLAPRLAAKGYRGISFTPEKTSVIMKDMLSDCAYINKKDAATLSLLEKKNYAPVFDMDDINIFMDTVSEAPIGKKIKLNEELSFMFIPNGHLFGSCQILLYITIDNTTKTILYTGDLGNPSIDNRFVGKLERVKSADLVIAESTYGDRPDLKTGPKDRNNDIDKIKSIIENKVVEGKGRLIIPCFAQSRIQQIAFMLWKISKDIKYPYKVYIDSPLAIKIFEEYEKVLEGNELAEYKEFLLWDKLVFVKSPEDSKSIINNKAPGIYLSTSGMCQAGRIRFHLKSDLEDSAATVLFVGYSSENSLASALKDKKKKTVLIDKLEYRIKCSSYNLKSFSGHAPFAELIKYYSSINTNRIVLHHGSPAAKDTLSKELKVQYEKNCSTTKVIKSNSDLVLYL